MLKSLCSGGKDGSEQMESEGCGNDGLKLIRCFEKIGGSLILDIMPVLCNLLTNYANIRHLTRSQLQHSPKVETFK